MNDTTSKVLRVDGPLTMATAEGWLARGREAVRQGDLTVDFSAVSEADSAALALLLDWMRCAQAAGTRVRHRAMPAGLGSLAQLYGIDELLVAES